MTDMALTRSELSNKIFWGIPVKRTGRPKSACWSKPFRGPVLILTALKPLFPGLLCSGPTFPHCFRNAFAAGGRHPTYGALSEKSSKTFSCPASPSAKRIASWKSLHELSRRVDELVLPAPATGNSRDPLPILNACCRREHLTGAEQATVAEEH
jgi:hypothetical protein